MISLSEITPSQMLLRLFSTNKGLTDMTDSPTRKYVKGLAALAEKYSQTMTTKRYKIFCNTLTISNSELAEEDEGSEIDTWTRG